MKYSSVTSDSRKVTKNGVFVAIKGLTYDGHSFIDQAVKAGASLIVGENDRPKTLPKNVSYEKVLDSREALGKYASSFYGDPFSKMKIIGVTGTDGKTTTASLIHYILTKNKIKCGLISTVSAIIGSSVYDTGLHVTNPDTVSLHFLLKKMVDEGCKVAVIEVTSHGIDQKRIAGINFDYAVLTNITPEHLDYHKTFANYRNTKIGFLAKAGKVFVNKNDINLSSIKEVVNKDKINYYALNSDLEGILPGKFNELNASAATTVCGEFGIERKHAISMIQSFKLPSGRLQEIENNLGIKIYIDFAHTPNSLKEVLQGLKLKTQGKLIVVFGCAGERDPKKRYLMGKIAAKLADRIVITAEDPRSENVFQIMSKIAEGARSQGAKEGRDYFKIAERGEAISFAINKAVKKDCVVICGKGHEQSMCYKNFEHPWNDEKYVKAYLDSEKDLVGIILAAGKGTRMKSKLAKVLHEICGRVMISYTLENLRMSGIPNIIPVVGFKRNFVLKRFNRYLPYAIQKKTMGTGDALKRGIQEITNKVSTVLVINGDDSAFYTKETIKKLIIKHKNEKAVISFVSFKIDNPTGFGRIVRGDGGKIQTIVEEKDATDEQRKIKEVNDGLYVFDYGWLKKNIGKIVKSAVSGEYYIVDLVKIAIAQGEKVYVHMLSDISQWQGVNNPEQLAEAENKMRVQIKKLNPWLELENK